MRHTWRETENKTHLELFPPSGLLESTSMVSALRALTFLDPNPGVAGAALGAVPTLPPVGTAVVALAPITGAVGSIKMAGGMVPRAAAGVGVEPLAGTNAGIAAV